MLVGARNGHVPALYSGPTRAKPVGLRMEPQSASADNGERSGPHDGRGKPFLYTLTVLFGAAGRRGEGPCVTEAILREGGRNAGRTGLKQSFGNVEETCNRVRRKRLFGVVEEPYNRVLRMHLFGDVEETRRRTRRKHSFGNVEEPHNRV